MTVMKDKEFRGRRQRVGAPLFTDSGKLCFFVGYCPDCKGKCTVSSEEARKLMRMFGSNRRKPIQRIMVRLVKKYATD